MSRPLPPSTNLLADSLSSLDTPLKARIRIKEAVHRVAAEVVFRTHPSQRTNTASDKTREILDGLVRVEDPFVYAAEFNGSRLIAAAESLAVKDECFLELSEPGPRLRVTAKRAAVGWARLEASMGMIDAGAIKFLLIDVDRGAVLVYRVYDAWSLVGICLVQDRVEEAVVRGYEAVAELLRARGAWDSRTAFADIIALIRRMKGGGDDGGTDVSGEQ